MKRSTIEIMMSNAVASQIAWTDKTDDLRAGHGCDRARSLGNHKFYGQKGGDLDTTGNVIQFDGDWGFAMCWGGKAIGAPDWYPNYPDVMNLAKSALADATDLFP